jgi:hypothetical protein
MSFNGFFDSVGEGVIYLPIVKYDARSGRITRRDRENGESNDVDITRSFKAIMDFENVEIGWSDFTNGPPDFRLVRFADGGSIPKPSEGNFKRCVRFVVKLSKECGGDVREFASNAGACLDGIKKLKDEYDAGVKSNPGKLPVVSLADTIAKTSSGGALKTTNYVPVFEITGWVKRPDDLVYQSRSSSAPSAAPSAPPATGSTKVSAPAGGDDDFG